MPGSGTERYIHGCGVRTGLVRRNGGHTGCCRMELTGWWVVKGVCDASSIRAVKMRGMPETRMVAATVQYSCCTVVRRSVLLVRRPCIRSLFNVFLAFSLSLSFSCFLRLCINPLSLPLLLLSIRILAFPA